MKPAYSKHKHTYGVIQEIFPRNHYYGCEVVVFFTDGSYRKVNTLDTPAFYQVGQEKKYFVEQTDDDKTTILLYSEEEFNELFDTRETI